MQQPRSSGPQTDPVKRDKAYRFDQPDFIDCMFLLLVCVLALPIVAVEKLKAKMKAR